MKHLLDEIRAWDASGDLRWSDEHFERRALELFAAQYEAIEPYRRFCDRRDRTPRDVESWLDVPSVPTDAFKRIRLSSAPAGATVRTFRTSGTTQGERGEHHFGSLDYYRAAIDAPFRRFCMPDRKRMPMWVLAPSPGDMPDSSLSYMLGELLVSFGTPLRSGFFIVEDDESGELTFDFEGIHEALESADRPVMLLGTAFAFVELFDTFEDDFRLPAGSRIMETGGLKGRTREVSREELYSGFESKLGVDPTHCIAEYSMTELSSQAYTDSLSRGLPPDESRFRTPPWARVVAVDPVSLEPLGPGERGLLRWYDLANVESVLAVQTSDLGVVDADGGFQLFGRAEGAELRGCSLTVEEIADTMEGRA